MDLTNQFKLKIPYLLKLANLKLNEIARYLCPEILIRERGLETTKVGWISLAMNAKCLRCD